MILLVIVISSPPALRFAVEHPRLDMGLFGGAAVALFVYGLVHRSVSIPRYLLTNVVGFRCVRRRVVVYVRLHVDVGSV